MYDWRELVRLSDGVLAQLDIAAVNLACGAGLSRCDRIDAERCLRTIDDMARRCHAFTEQVMPMFHSGRCDYPESEPKFRIQAMITHLQRDMGVRYHPGRMADISAFEDVDHFLHGIFLSEGGTCGSMPVLYVAVGRRLGYPVGLVTTRNHLFARWDGSPGGERFNIEGAGNGISFFPDAHYRQDMPPEAIRACRYLESQSPRRELAGFMSQRAHCFQDRKDWHEASIAFAWANELAPGLDGQGSGMYALLTVQALRAWDEALRRRLPRRLFPKLDIGLPAHYFRELPREIERELIRMRVQQSVLDDADYERRWWAPLRSRPYTRPAGLPEVLRIDYRWNSPAVCAGQPI